MRSLRADTDVLNVHLYFNNRICYVIDNYSPFTTNILIFVLAPMTRTKGNFYIIFGIFIFGNCVLSRCVGHEHLDC